MSRLRKIRFGTGVKWADVEADEATFGKKMEKGQLHWEQWCGIVQRGKPDTLVLHRLKPPASKLEPFARLNGNLWLQSGCKIGKSFSIQILPPVSLESCTTESYTRRRESK